jgi:hypothetical protein
LSTFDLSKPLKRSLYVGHLFPNAVSQEQGNTIVKY